ncbi:prostaglandin reductase 1-like isoform X2 [Rhynchophorus ferrugineus]|uniref:Prostaglandin reductase 1 n=1 Tax=Rhynchophorus ferrugineus TaxID=354439 RepID=A0A834IJM5_RHYFE|nr:hypothetical protein GWI33_011882 [Rhynchophorus ferrugineus]
MTVLIRSLYSLLRNSHVASQRSYWTNMVKAKAYIYHKRFEGFPKETDLKLVEEELPPLSRGEFLAEAVYLSVDPYMRAYARTLPTGNTFIGQQIARIVESKNKDFPVGKYVVASFGWRTHTISNGVHNPSGTLPITLLPDFQGLPESLGLGVLGMPGNTAYFGFLELCRPKAGETVVVSGAAGAVGSHVGQIAKIKGCTVIGIAGSDEKCKWITHELGFDHAINYKTQDVEQALQELAPKGIDCYFDNVGGEISSTVLSQMNLFGRVSVCGAISGYNDEKPKAAVLQPYIVMKQLQIEGFMVYRWLDRWLEGVNQNLKWIQEGKLKYREKVTEGFGNMFYAFTDMLKGGNLGKAIVKV